MPPRTTVEIALEYIKILKAFTEGKEIQFKNNSDGVWSTTTSPCWDFNKAEYRIKPKPTYKYVGVYRTINGNEISVIRSVHCEFKFIEEHGPNKFSKWLLGPVAYQTNID